jgi:hypothetical protein
MSHLGTVTITVLYLQSHRNERHHIRQLDDYSFRLLPDKCFRGSTGLQSLESLIAEENNVGQSMSNKQFVQFTPYSLP